MSRMLAWMVVLSLTGCIERVATADPSPDALPMDALPQDALLRDALASDAVAAGDASDAMAAGDATIADDGVGGDAHLDAMPPPSDDATVPTDCVLPPPPPQDCSPEGAGLGDAQALPFQPIVRDSAFEDWHIAMADGCRWRHAPSGLYDFASEAEFQEALVCGEGVEPVPSTINWATTRLVLATVSEGLGAVTWVVTDGRQTRLGIDEGTQCGGATPELGFAGAFIPATAPPVGGATACRPNLGPQGCCACDVICDPEPRLGECVCPP